MNQYLSVSRFESALAPGVVYKLRLISHSRRVELNLSQAPVFKQIEEIDRELRPVQEEIARAREAAKISPCTCDHSPEGHDQATGRCSVPGCSCREPKPENDAWEREAELVMNRLRVIIDELYPMYARWGVRAIEGLEIDGQPATIDTLIADGPEPLLAEVASEIIRLTKLSAEEQLGFKLPGTSGAPVLGQTQVSTAPPAEEGSSTPTSSAAA